MTAPQPDGDELDQALRALEAEALARPPAAPQPPIYGPMTPGQGRRNLLALGHALGGLQRADHEWLAAHPLPDHEDHP